VYLCDCLIVIDIVQVKKLAASYVILGQVDVLKELSTLMPFITKKLQSN